MYILSSLCEDASFLSALLFAKKITEIISIIIPSILVLLLTIDFVQGVMGDEEKMQKVKSIAIKRIIYALLIFFVPIIVDTAMTLLEDKNMLKSDCYTNATDENISKLIDKQDARDRKREAEIQKKIAEREKINEKKRKEIEKNAKKVASNRKTGSSGYSNKKVDQMKSYSKLKVLKTYDSSNMTKLTTFNVGSRKVPQSFCSNGSNYIVQFQDFLGDGDRLIAFSKSGTLLKKGEKFNGGHGNGLACGADNKIFSVDRGDKRCVVLNGTTLKKEKTFNLPYEARSIAYDPDTNQYYISNGGKIHVLDNNFKKVRTIKMIGHGIKFHQDMGAYHGIILQVITMDKGGKNYIDMYRAKDGAYLGSYKVKVGELESVFVDNGKLVFLMNKMLTSKDHIYVSNNSISIP